mmetsp:Transcript_52627/g.123124  ORF Transcript_52627/g.123124 Transcript_52627/m.123124 type:complete len:475 (-) Transcript_52627:95-1519(-)
MHHDVSVSIVPPCTLVAALPDSQKLFLADCYYGVVSIMLNAIPAVEFEEGLEAAQGLLLQARNLIDRQQTGENWTFPVNWSFAQDPLELSFPFVLGLRANNCAGSTLKIFVYDTANYSAGSLFCSAGQWGIEVMIHRYFETSACRTFNPDEADFFVVPDYRACHLHLAPNRFQAGLTRIDGDDYHSKIIMNHHTKYRRPSDAEELFKNLVASLPYFPRRKGLDHIFIFSDQGFIVNFTHTFPSWRDVIPHSIFLTTEAFTPGCGPSCFSPWKDLVIPGHTDRERMQRMSGMNRPSAERTVFFNFHGRLPANHDYYQNNTVRGALMELAVLPNVSIGGFIEEYFEVMGSSHFCIIPEGTSSWTNHLYESFFAGCIPLILSDNFVLPYQDLIDWPRLSLRWPQASVDAALYVYIRDFVENRKPELERMKAAVDAAACWFDYYGLNASCSPYKGILHGLEGKLKSRPDYLHPNYWVP